MRIGARVSIKPTSPYAYQSKGTIGKTMCLPYFSNKIEWVTILWDNGHRNGYPLNDLKPVGTLSYLLKLNK